MSQGLVIPAHVAEKMNARTEVCGNCKWRYKAKETAPDVECRRHPPTASLNMVPVQAGPLARPGPQQMGLQPFSLYPLIRDDQFCGEWEAKREVVS